MRNSQPLTFTLKLTLNQVYNLLSHDCICIGRRFACKTLAADCNSNCMHTIPYSQDRHLSVLLGW